MTEAAEQVAAVATLPAGPLSPRAARARAAELRPGVAVIVECEGRNGEPLPRPGVVAAEPVMHRGHAAWRERGYIAADYWLVSVHLEGEAEPRPFALERVAPADRRGCRRTPASRADVVVVVGEANGRAGGGLGAPPGGLTAWDRMLQNSSGGGQQCTGKEGPGGGV